MNTGAKPISLQRAWKLYLAAQSKYAQDHFLYQVGVHLGVISNQDVLPTGRGRGVSLSPAQKEAILVKASEAGL